jgi:hypothetical protein
VEALMTDEKHPTLREQVELHRARDIARCSVAPPAVSTVAQPAVQPVEPAAKPKKKKKRKRR